MAVSLWNGTRVMQDAGLQRNRASVKYEQHTPCKRVVLLDGPLNGSSAVNATLGMPTYCTIAAHIMNITFTVQYKLIVCN